MRRAANRRSIEPQHSEANGKRGCHGKRQYESFHIAEKLAKRQRRQHDSTVAEYRCLHCGKWHIGEGR